MPAKPPTRASTKAGRHRFYGLKAWQHPRRGLRAEALKRDRYTCQACGRVEASARLHAHHRVPHKGNRKLFFDIDNLVCLCQSCHDTSARETETYGYALEIDAQTGLPTDERHPFLRGRTER